MALPGSGTSAFMILIHRFDEHNEFYRRVGLA